MHRKFNDDIFARCLVIMNIEGRLWGHPVTSSKTSSSCKYFFCIIWDDISHIWGQIEAVFHISKFSKWPPFSIFDQFCDLVASSMRTWIFIYIIVVIIWWYICTGSLMMTSSSWKYFFLHNLGRYFHIWGRIEAVCHISKFSNGRHFELATNFFTGSYTGRRIYQKIAMSISDILSFWSTL